MITPKDATEILEAYRASYPLLEQGYEQMNIDFNTAPKGTEGHGYLGFRLQPVWFGEDWYEYLGSGKRHPFGGPCCYFKNDVKKITKNPFYGEELEAQSREKSIQAMQFFIARSGLTSDYSGMCRALYDAGYRKFEIVEDDV